MRVVRSENNPAGKARIAEDREHPENFNLEFPEGVVGGRWLIVNFEPGQTTGWHAVHCLVYVTVVAGEVEFALDGGDKTIVRPGDYVIEGDNTLHSWTNVGSGQATLSAVEVDLD